MEVESPNIHRTVKGILDPLFKQIEKEFTKVVAENEELRKRLKSGGKAAVEERKLPKGEKITPRKTYSVKKVPTKQSFCESLIVAQFRDHNDVINEIAYDKSIIATCSADKTVKFWDMNTSKCMSSYFAHVGSVNSVRLHPQRDLAITASGDLTSHIFSVNLSQNISQNTPLLTLKGHKDTVSAADWLSSADQVITASYDQNLHVYSAETGDMVAKLAGHSQSVRNVVTENSLALSASADCSFKLWDLRLGGYPVKTYSFHSQAVNSVIFGANNMVVSASDDRTVRIFDLRQSMCCLHSVSLPFGANRISMNRDNLIAIPLDSGIIYLVDCFGNNIGKFRSSSVAGHSPAITCVCWMDNGNLLSGGADSKVMAWMLPRSN